MLKDDDIRGLWQQANSFPEWSEWISSYLAALQRIQALGPTKLKTSEGQKILWAEKGLGSIGSGESVVVPDAATRDAEIAAAIAGLPERKWPADDRERARLIAGEYDRILDLLASRHTKRRPHARLLRAFAALLPAQMHCGFNWRSQQDVAALLLDDSVVQELAAVETHVLCRARLRAVLGVENAQLENVRRSVFCWWLHENRAEIEKGGIGAARAVAPSIDAPPAPITVLPFNKQFKGNFAVSRMTACYRDVIRECLSGSPRSDLVEVLGANQDFATLSLASRKQLIARLQSLGLIEQGPDGQVRATRSGEELLDNDLPDALVEKLLERVYPFAAFLRFMRQGARTTKEMKAQLRDLYPNWTEDVGPSHLIAWCRDLGLIEKSASGDTVELTDYGVFGRSAFRTLFQSLRSQFPPSHLWRTLPPRCRQLSIAPDGQPSTRCSRRGEKTTRRGASSSRDPNFVRCTSRCTAIRGRGS